MLLILNFSKSFDTVNYQLLFTILEHLGIGQLALKLFKGYFSNRLQSVNLDRNSSAYGNLACGVS